MTQTWTIHSIWHDQTSQPGGSIRVLVAAPDGETRLTVLGAGELAALSRKITYDGKEAPRNG